MNLRVQVIFESNLKLGVLVQLRFKFKNFGFTAMLSKSTVSHFKCGLEGFELILDSIEQLEYKGSSKLFKALQL